MTILLLYINFKIDKHNYDPKPARLPVKRETDQTATNRLNFLKHKMRIKPENFLKFNNAIAFYFAFLLIAFICSTSFGQSITWQKVLNNNFGVLNKVIQTPDGGFIGVGTDRMNNFDKMYLVKLDNFGNVLWTKIIGIGNAEGYWIEQTIDNGLIIGGSIDSGFGDTQAYLVKIDMQGNMQWHMSYSNSGLDQCYCVKQIYDGGFILSCRTSPSNLNKAMFIRTDPMGNLIWKKIYGNGANTIVSEIQIIENGFIGVGYNGLQNTADGYLIKLNYNGDTIWTKKFGGNGLDGFYSLDKVSLQGFVLAGTSDSYNIRNRPESYLVRIDTNGSELWHKTFSGYDYDVCKTVRYKQGVGFILAGYSDSIAGNDTKAKVRIISETGLLLKETSYLPNTVNCTLSVFNSAEMTGDGGFIFAGYDEITSFLSMYVVKTDSLLFSNPIGISSNHHNIPIEYSITQNYPNPFNPNTNIILNIMRTAKIKLLIYDIEGKLIYTIIDQELFTGSYKVSIDFNKLNISSGVYFYSLYLNNSTQPLNTKKMIYLK